MAGLRVVLAAFAMALPLWIAELTPAQACTGSIAPLEERVTQYVVAIGTVRELRLIGPTPALPENGETVESGPAEWVVDVEEYLSGSGPTTLAIFEPTSYAQLGADQSVEVRSASLCGWADQVGGRYLLFLAPREDGRFDTSRFSGSVPFLGNYALDQIEQVRAIVRAQDLALPDTGSGGAKDPSIELPLALGLAGTLLASAALLLGRRLGE